MAPVGFSISGIPGAPFGPMLRMTTTSPACTFPLCNAFYQVMFAIKYAGSAFKAFTFLATDFGYASTFGEVAI